MEMWLVSSSIRVSISAFPRPSGTIFFIVVKKGDFVLVLPDEKHQYKNRSSKTPFMMICAVPKEYE
jgi:hypothetical protein